MPRGLIRIHGGGNLHFITASCYRRESLLGSARARNVFLEIFEQVRKSYGFEVIRLSCGGGAIIGRLLSVRKEW